MTTFTELFNNNAMARVLDLFVDNFQSKTCEALYVSTIVEKTGLSRKFIITLTQTLLEKGIIITIESEDDRRFKNYDLKKRTTIDRDDRRFRYYILNKGNPLVKAIIKLHDELLLLNNDTKHQKKDRQVKPTSGSVPSKQSNQGRQSKKTAE